MEWIEVAEQAGGHDEMRLRDGQRGAERIPDGHLVIRLAANAGHTLSSGARAYFDARSPARAASSSCCEVPPLHPIAPTVWLARTMGSAP